MLCGILGAGIRSVKHLGKGVQRRIQVNWTDGRTGLLIVGQAAAWMPFYATIATQKSVTQYIADSGKLYRALLEATLPFLSGQTDTPPAPMDELVEAELCALAARKSWLEGDREVALSELTGIIPEEIAAAENALLPVRSLEEQTGEDEMSLERQLGVSEEESVVTRISLYDAIKTLKKEERMVISLRFFKGLTQEQTARILSTSQVQISRIQKRALARLKLRIFG
jgi:RNA polymerase sigma factor (sigma-70 family)